MKDLIRVERALISVSDKTDLDFLAKGLRNYNPEMDILSSGGTATKLREFGYDVRDVSQYTGFPESPDGLLKTIHPLVAGGILLDADVADQRQYMEKNGILPINLVVVNFYPLRKMIEEGKSIEQIRMHGIDIGGPNMVRAAAKSYPTVAIVTDPTDYNRLIAELDTHGGVTFDTRFELSRAAWGAVLDYDMEIYRYGNSLKKEEAREFYLGKQK
ncbi:MAG: IMP cyclohydrolase [Candidatus Aenigmarchaeota archaeon]|nr:IMP cyclohydrolase [Candidatus Aenigmarchaeota archaeon]